MQGYCKSLEGAETEKVRKAGFFVSWSADDLFFITLGFYTQNPTFLLVVVLEVMVLF